MVRRRSVIGGVGTVAALRFWGTQADWDSDDEVQEVPQPEVKSDGVHRQGSWLDLDQAAVEQAFHEEVNKVRERPLKFSPRLARVARYHSWDMAKQSYVAHESPDGETVDGRYARFGVRCEGGENIWQTWAFTETKNSEGESVWLESEEEIATAAINTLLDSEAHRENMLNKRWTAEGIGVWWIPDQHYGGVRVYITQNFC